MDNKTTKCLLEKIICYKKIHKTKFWKINKAPKRRKDSIYF